MHLIVVSNSLLCPHTGSTDAVYNLFIWLVGEVALKFTLCSPKNSRPGLCLYSVSASSAARVLCLPL